SVGRGRPAAGSASMRTSRPRSRVRATSSASGSSPRSSRGGRSGAVRSEAEPVSQIEVTRQEWEEGRRRFEAAREDGRRYRQLLGLLELEIGRASCRERGESSGVGVGVKKKKKGEGAGRVVDRVTEQ